MYQKSIGSLFGLSACALVASLVGVSPSSAFAAWDSTVNIDESDPADDDSGTAVTHWGLLGVYCVEIDWEVGGEADNKSCSAFTTGDMGVNDTASSSTVSVTKTASSSYNFEKRIFWEGCDPRPSRRVIVSASGTASETVIVTCSVDADTSVTAGASGSGAASCSLDTTTASADLSMTAISINAHYDSATSKTEWEGQFGTTVDDNSASVNGSYSNSSSYQTTGQGSENGSASYTVKSGRTYDGNTVADYTVSRSGAVAVTGGGTVLGGETISWEAEADVSVTITDTVQ